MALPRSTLWLLGALAVAGALYLWSRTQSGAAAAAGVVGTVVDSVSSLFSGPRGIRNNNPGNIVRGSVTWQGQLTADQVSQAPPVGIGIPYDSTFVQFDSPANGVRAIGHVLLSYQARNLSSVDQIIRTYSATDQDAYVANVAAALGVDPSQTIDVSANLPALAAAIIQQENGEQPYDPNDLATWVYA